MPSTTYVAHHPGPFSALVQAPEIGGLRLHPLPPARVRDRFFDTPTGALLGRGLALRVREREGRWTAALRRLPGGPRNGALPPDVDLGAGGGARLDLPPGPLVDAVRPIVGDEPLGPIVSIRQYRTPRVCLDGNRPVGLLSLDVVVYEVPGADVVLNEAEVETTDAASDADRQRLDAALRRHGLELAALSKIEGAFLRVPRSLTQPVLLLPVERTALEAAARTASPMIRRRARVVLLDARGLRPDTIAAQTGLSMSRVRHWRLQFREHRLEILEPERVPLGTPPAPWAPVPATPAEPAPDTGSAEGNPGEGVPAEAEPPETPPVPPSPPEPSSPAPSRREEPADGETPPEHRVETSIPDAGSGGNGQAAPQHEAVEDMSDLLDLFRPSETATPLLDEEAWDDDAPAPAPPPAEVRPGPRPAFPVVLGPVAGPGPPPSLGGPRTGAAPPLRRPRLAGDAPLLEAAHATLAYHVAAFEAASRRFVGTRSLLDARRLHIAAHRVRLAADAFRPVLPDHAVRRLVGALRPLVEDLDAAIDLGRAAGVSDATRVALASRHAATVERVAARLGDGRRQPWGDRARRLLARLDAQQADGLLVGDDVPEPTDDFVGRPGEAPQPARLRHIAASLLWSRYEAIRAFEGDLTGEGAGDTAYHVAVAVSALHFAVGLTAAATDGPVRAVAETLDAAEARVMAVRNGLADAAVVAAAGGDPPALPDFSAVRAVWDSLMDAAFRRQLAALSAGV